MFSILNKLFQRSKPAPDPYAMPDMTGYGLPMEYWISAIGKANSKKPAVGDVIAKLVSCGMGVSVKHDIRFVVKGTEGRWPTSFGIVDAKTGAEGEMHVHNLRQHTSLPRTWIEIA